MKNWITLAIFVIGEIAGCFLAIILSIYYLETPLLKLIDTLTLGNIFFMIIIGLPLTFLLPIFLFTAVWYRLVYPKE